MNMTIEQIKAAYPNVAKLESQAGRELLVAVVGQMNALAAENAGLNNAIDSIETKYMNWEGLSDAFSDARDIKTLTTDAFLAEVLAQGVEMFVERLQLFIDDGDFDSDELGLILGAVDCGKEFAAEIRQGAAL